MSFGNKELNAILDKGYPIFSCLQILTQASSCSRNQYVDLLRVIRTSMDKDDVTFCWQGIERHRIETELSSSNTCHPLDNLSKILSSQTLEWLNLKRPASNFQNLISPLPDWDAFRKLIHYFIECIQQEAGAVAAHYEEEEGKQFIYLPQHGDWMPRTGKPYTGFVQHHANYAGFLNHLASNDPSIPLVFGYPVETWVLPQSHDDIPPSAIVRPVFQFKMSYDPRRRCFFTLDPIPEVNFAWLNKRLRNKDQKKAFLRSCGFMDVNENTESMLGDISQSLWHITSTISALLPDYIREPLLSHSVPGDSIQGRKSGIYNRAVLMLGKRGRYVKTLISELTYIAERPNEELERTALGALFFKKSEHTDPRSQFDHASTLLDTLSLNSEQRQAVASLQL